MSRFPAAVLFDFDGVLVDTEPLHFLAFRQVLRDEAMDVSEQQYYSTMLGLTDRDSFAYLYMKDNRCLSSEHLGELLARKSRIMMQLIERGECHPLPGVLELIPNLARTTPLAICSGARRAEIQAVLRQLDLSEHFRGIVSADDCPVGKPDPTGYQMAMRLAAGNGRSLTPSDCLIIEDSPTVVRAMKHAGFRILAVCTSRPASYFDQADWVAPTLLSKDLAPLLPQLTALADS